MLCQPSVEIPGCRGERAEELTVIEQAPGNEMDDVPLALDHPLHAEQARAEELPALALDQPLPDHHIHAAGFILERYKNDSAGGIRPLPAGDQPRNPRAAAALQLMQRACVYYLQPSQMRAQQGERMAP